MSRSPFPVETAGIPRPFRVSKLASYSTAIGSASAVCCLVFVAGPLHVPYDLIAIFTLAMGLAAWLGGAIPAFISMALLTVPFAMTLIRREPTQHIWLELAGTLVANGCIVMFIGTRRRIFAKLVVELIQLRRIVNWAPVAIILFGRKRAVQYFNATFAKMYGWSLDELRGQPLPLPDSELEEWTKLEDMLRRGEMFENVPAKRLRKDGSEFDVRISGIPVTDEVGVLAGMVGIAVLPDPRPELLARIELLEFLVNTTCDFICISDQSYRIQSLNNAG